MAGHQLEPFFGGTIDPSLTALESPRGGGGGGRGRGGGGGGGRGRGGGPGQHAARRPAQQETDAKPNSGAQIFAPPTHSAPPTHPALLSPHRGSHAALAFILRHFKTHSILHALTDFWDRILRPGGQGRNVTKVGSNTNPRDVASQIAAQARAAVDCPTLQCIGPSATNQAIKAISIARTYLAKSDASGQTAHPDVIVYPEFVKLDAAQHDDAGQPLSAIQLTLCKRVRRTSVDKEGRSLKVSSNTEAKALAGAIASCTREGSRVELTAIGAGSVNQAIKAIAIARQYVEEEAIDLCCRPKFVEIAEGAVGNEAGPAHGQGGPTSALNIIVLVEQT